MPYYRGYCFLPLYNFDDRQLLLAKLRKADIDAAAGANAEIARIVACLRKAWPVVEIWLLAGSGFTRDDMMTWCEENRVEYVLPSACAASRSPLRAACPTKELFALAHDRQHKLSDGPLIAIAA